MPVSSKLLELLACPICHTAVQEEGDRLVCSDCGRQYPVRGGIPVMIAREAQRPEQESKA